MDPFLALGVAGNIIQFIDFVTKIIHAAADIRGSAAVAAEEDSDIITSTTRLESFVARLEISKPASRLDDEEVELNILASECKRMSEDLLKFVKGLQASDPTSKRESLAAALKSVWKKPEKERMERRLEKCKSTLGLYLSDLSSSEIMERLSCIASSGRSTEAELASLNRNVKALRLGLEVSCINPAALDQIRNVVKLSDEADRRVRISRILRGLRFDCVDDRFENVAQAHDSTFRWMLRDDCERRPDDDDDIFDVDDSGARSTARNQLTEWLEHGSGVFRFSGKPGSKKSTLMKFLYNRPETRQLLRSWAGEKELATSQFFFWNPGTELQKSWKGLKRGLLYTLLSGSPNLLPLVLPEQWEAAALHDVHFEDRAIRQAFDNLLASESIHEKHKFVFFIDGLDELVGDHLDMVRRFTAWTTLQRNTIKLCVSSREWPVFEEGFKRHPTIQLHTVTRADICRFVRTRLEENRELTGLDQSPLKEDIVKAITSKADGVFIWVSLILRQIEHGLVNGDGIRDIQRKIDSLPTELEDMFTNLLDSIPSADRRKSYAMLFFRREMHHIGRRTTLLRLSFLEDYLDGERVDSVDCTKVLGEEAILQRLSRARKRVYGLCKGLLDITSPTPINSNVDMFTYRKSLVKQLQSLRVPESPGHQLVKTLELDDSGFVMLHPGLPDEKIPFSSELARVAMRIYRETVKFNHRSIVEFLQTKRASVRFKEATVGFDFFNAWQHGILWQLWSINISPALRLRWSFPDMPPLDRGDDSLYRELRTMIRWAIDNTGKADTGQMCVFLDRAGSATEATGDPQANLHIYFSRGLESTGEARTQLSMLKLTTAEMTTLLCLHTGFYEYLAWPGHRSSGRTRDHLRLWMLTTYISHDIFRSISILTKNWPRIARTIDAVLQGGNISPNECQPGTNVPCFFYLMLHFLTAQPASLSIIALFLYHGVDPRLRLNFQQGWKILTREHRGLEIMFSDGPDNTTLVTFKSGSDWVSSFTTLPRDILEEGNDSSLTLRNLVGLWFPGHVGRQLQEFIDWRCLHPADLPAATITELRTRFGKSLRDLSERGMPSAADPKGCLCEYPGFELTRYEPRPEDMADAARQY